MVGAVGNKQVDSATPLGTASHFSVGKGVQAVVMRTRQEYADEDARAKQAQIDEVEATMKGDARKAADYGSFDFKR